MIAERSKMNLKKFISQLPLNSESATMPKLMSTIKMNKNLESLLISRSNLPILVNAGFEFIYALVSLPVYTIMPKTWPLDASTVFAHSVFSRLRASR